MKETVVIAGATGFIGRNLARTLLRQGHHVIGLSRAAKTPSALDGVSEWRKCDLYSLLDAEKALVGADAVYYLVHSMLPSARLTQGNFQDMDLIAADNLARAAEKEKVKQIIYLGGIVPPDVELSDHLASRLEVEKTLRSHKTPVTALRAGLVIGAGGPSFDMIYKLVRRLPVMVCPSWTETKTQPIGLSDAIKLLQFTLGNQETYNQTFDIGVEEILTYRQLLFQTATLMGLKRYMPSVPVFSLSLSRLWLELTTGSPKQLVGPLVESLKYPMLVRDQRLATLAHLKVDSLRHVLKEALIEEDKRLSQKKVSYKERHKPTDTGDVRSVQRLPLPKARTAQWVAQKYMEWLPRFLPWFLKVEITTENLCTFYLRFWPKPLLVLKLDKERSAEDRQLFRIQGGFLARTEGRGRLEFREILNGKFVIAAIHEFRPRLPWYIYVLTQAQLHSWIMKSFGRYLARYSSRGAKLG